MICFIFTGRTVLHVAVILLEYVIIAQSYQIISVITQHVDHVLNFMLSFYTNENNITKFDYKIIMSPLSELYKYPIEAYNYTPVLTL